MKSAKHYIVIWLLTRVLLIVVGFTFYATSCPIEIDSWILWAVSISAILEPLLLLLVALLVEENSTAKNSKK